jgi:hypothetical protein
MEDPANQLKITDELLIKDDIKDKILKLKKSICDSILVEDHAINTEIRSLEDNKITMAQLQSEDEDVEIKGISMTSILVYINEIEQIDPDNADSSKMSHKAFPGKAIV